MSSKKKKKNKETQETQAEELQPEAEIEEKAEEELPEPVVLERAEYNALVAEKDSNHDKFMRNAAEFDNFRKRVQREKSLWEISVYKKVLQDILTIQSSVTRGIAVHEGDCSGLEAIRDQICAILDNHEVKPMVTEGKQFDPELHEAIFMEENDQVPDRTILEEIEIGYLFRDAVLVPAKVKVSKKPAPAVTEEEDVSDDE